MGLVRGALASSLSVGLALSAGVALAGAPAKTRINGDFVVQDSLYPGDVAVVEIDLTIHDVSGFVSGPGTEGDVVVVSFFTPAPNDLRANDKKGSVVQSSYSQLLFSISSAARNLSLTVAPEQCSVRGRTSVTSQKGGVNVKCSGENLFEEVRADQLASIQAAFQGNKRVKVKVSRSNPAKGSISIHIEGDSFKEE
jgi:hypothetical protein